MEVRKDSEWPVSYGELTADFLLDQIDDETSKRYMEEALAAQDWPNLERFARLRVLVDKNRLVSWLNLAKALENLDRNEEAFKVYIDQITRIEIRRHGGASPQSERAILRLRARIQGIKVPSNWPQSYTDLTKDHLAVLGSLSIKMLADYSRQATTRKDAKMSLVFTNEILRRDPNNLGALTAKASTVRRMGNPHEALELLMRVNEIQITNNYDSRRTALNIASIEEEIRWAKPVAPAVESAEVLPNVETVRAEVGEEVAQAIETPAEPEAVYEPVPKIPGMLEFFRQIAGATATWEKAKEFGVNWLRIPESELPGIVAEFARYKELARQNLGSARKRSTEATSFLASFESLSLAVARGGLNPESIYRLVEEASTVRELFS